VAAFAQGDIKGGDIHLAELQKRLAANTGNDFLKSAVAEASVYKALAQGDRAEAQARIPECRNLFKDREARLWMAAGDPEKAEAAAREAVKTGPNETAPLATLVDILARNGRTFEAGQRFEELRAAASTADLDTPLLARLQPLAREMGHSVDWRAPQKPSADTGARPPLETLGPFAWQPPSAPDFTLKSVEGRTVSLSEFRRAGKPLLMLFYLGGKCAPCMEQLNTFAPLHKEFEDAGITLMAVTVEGMEEARKSLKTDSGWKVPFPVLCDPSRKIYKKYRAYDDFEEMPLHGAYLIDGQGYLRWLDVRFEPFKNARFLLDESRRLISRPVNPRQASAPTRRG
jgi:peroxiredoxin